jgi:hypothetical protein
VANINTAVERWYFEKGSWPETNLNNIEADPEYFPEGEVRCPVDGTEYKLDGTTHRVQGHAH